MKKLVICTLCPNGCEIEVEYTGKTDAKIAGNRCERGSGYAFSECFDPHRIFTGSVKIDGSIRKRLPVRSNKPIPKDKMKACAELLKTVKLEAPVEAGHTVLENVFGSGTDIVATMSLRREQYYGTR